MKEYTKLCLHGMSTFPERKAILQAKREKIQQHIHELQGTLQYIDAKEEFYDDVLSGKREYIVNLIPCQCAH